MKPNHSYFGKSDMIKRIKQVRALTPAECEQVGIVVFVMVASLIMGACLYACNPGLQHEYPQVKQGNDYDRLFNPR